MTADRDTTRIVRSWLEDGRTTLPDRVLDAVLDQLPATPQRRAWWPARRFFEMNAAMRMFIAGAAAVLVVGVVGTTFWPRAAGVGGPPPSVAPTPTPSATPSPMAFHDGTLVPGRYVMTPFAGTNASTRCFGQAGCTEDPADDSIRVAFTVADDVAGIGNRPLIWIHDEGVGLIVLRGSDLYGDPCHTTPPPDVKVGPTVDDFANALAAHPLLDASTPVPVTLAGYSGKYVDLQLPADIAKCKEGQFWPFEPGVYSQGPSHRWHLWILDVNGVRVVIQSMDFADTPAARRAELQAIVDSITIQP